MEGDPFALIEGMAIAAVAVGATKGFVYTRSEYPHAIATFDAALATARAHGAARRRGVRLGPRVRYRATDRRRRLCLRRGDLAARQPGRQARPGARQAAAAGAQGAVRPADGGQQRRHPRQRAVHPGARAPTRTTGIGMAAPAAPCRSSLPATCATPGCSRPASA